MHSPPPPPRECRVALHSAIDHTTRPSRRVAEHGRVPVQAERPGQERAGRLDRASVPRVACIALRNVVRAGAPPWVATYRPVVRASRVAWPHARVICQWSGVPRRSPSTPRRKQARTADTPSPSPAAPSLQRPRAMIVSTVRWACVVCAGAATAHDILQAAWCEPRARHQHRAAAGPGGSEPRVFAWVACGTKTGAASPSSSCSLHRKPKTCPSVHETGCSAMWRRARAPVLTF